MNRRGVSRAAIYYLLEGPAPPPPPGPDVWPYPACPLNLAVPFADASFWFEGEAGHDETENDGFFVGVTTITIRRPGNGPPNVPWWNNTLNAVGGLGFIKAAMSNSGASTDMPHDCVVSAKNLGAGVTQKLNHWSYIYFENIPYWQTHPVQIDWLAFSADLFDPALAGGVEIWCATPAGASADVQFNAYFIVGTGSIPLPSPWITHALLPPLVLDTNMAVVTTLGGVLNGAIADQALANDQWATAIIRSYVAPPSGESSIGVLLRASASVETWYRCRAFRDSAGLNGYAIEKSVAGVVTVLASHSSMTPSAAAPMIGDGNELGGEVVGSTINLLRDGVVLLTATDSAIASGRAGLVIANSTVGPTGAGVDGFLCGNGPAMRRTRDGVPGLLYNFAQYSNLDTTLNDGPTADIVGNPSNTVQPAELLYTLTEPSQLPITIPVPAGRALIFRTVNQDPQTLPPGSNITGDIWVGFLDPDPAGAYKSLSSAEPTATTIFTVKTANRLRLRGLAHQVLVGGTFVYRQAVLVYRDPTRLPGTTLRFPLTAPYLWFTEDPAETFFGNGMEVTLTAYAVDETELVGTSAEQWATVRPWAYADVVTRLQGELAHVDLVTTDENTFASGAGDFDVPLGAGQRLVYYVFTAVATPGFPTAGLHVPSILHGNASIS